MKKRRIAVALMLTSLVAAPASYAQDMTFTTEETGQPAEPPAEGPPSEALANALRLYQQDRHQEACVQFQRVVEGETQDAPANVQKAQFFLGKCLYHLRYYQSALAVFDEIGQTQGHLFFTATLQWLAQLASQLPEPAGIIDRVGRYGVEALEQFNNSESADLYNQLLYLLGRFKYQQGEFEEAVRLFQRVARTSRYYVQARFFEGITHVRQRTSRPAIAAFRAIIDAVDEGVEGVEDEDRMTDLAWLSMARVYYSAAIRRNDEGETNIDGRLLANAVEAWNRINVDSEYWLDALFEESWAFFLADETSRALGNIHTLNSPFFEAAYYPEAQVLKAVVFFGACQFDNAEAVIARFNERYEPLKVELEQYLNQYRENTDFFAFLQRVRAGTANLPPRIRPVVESALGDRTLLRNIEYVRLLEEEERRVNASPAEFRNSSLGARILQDISVAKSLAIDAAGDLARGRYNRLVDDLADLLNQATAIQIEILNARRGQLGGSGPPPNAQGGRVEVDDEHMIWPFDGEYWRDELGYYRQEIRSECGR